MRLERSLEFEIRRQYSNYAVMAAKEEIVRPRTYATYLIVFEKCRALVFWELDLADFEEIEGSPLGLISARSNLAHKISKTY